MWLPVRVGTDRPVSMSTRPSPLQLVVNGPAECSRPVSEQLLDASLATGDFGGVADKRVTVAVGHDLRTRCYAQTCARRGGLTATVGDSGMRNTLGVDGNKDDLVIALVPAAGSTLPDRFEAADRTPIGLGRLVEHLTGHLSTNDVNQIVIVSDFGIKPSGQAVRERAQLETAMILAAYKVGAGLEWRTVGDALEHLGLDKAKDKRGRLCIALTAALGDERLSPDPKRRAAAIGVALAATGLDCGDLDAD